jgi:hypothetical protein
MYDTGFKVLSMKIKYLAPLKHKHKHLKLVHENSHAMKECQVANFHGQASDAYVYV